MARFFRSSGVCLLVTAQAVTKILIRTSSARIAVSAILRNHFLRYPEVSRGLIIIRQILNLRRNTLRSGARIVIRAKQLIPLSMTGVQIVMLIITAVSLQGTESPLIVHSATLIKGLTISPIRYHSIAQA